MERNEKSIRITYKHSQPNPLFQSWLQELYDEAKEKRSKLESMLKIALDSLSKYPIPLNSGSECAILKGFGKKLCLFLDKKLQVYRTLHLCESDPTGLSDTEKNKVKNVNTSHPIMCAQDTVESMEVDPQRITASNSAKPSKSKSPKARKQYKPSHKTGSYAILIALLNNLKENPSNTSLTKEQLIEKAQPFSEESFTRPKAYSHYTAWSNITRLISKGLVEKTRSRKPMFSLTDEGISLAMQLEIDNKDMPSVNDIIFNNASFSNHSQDNNKIKPLDKCKSKQGNIENDSVNNIIEMHSGSFDVILIIDKNETSGLTKKNDPTVTQFKKYPDLKHEYRSLKVGDFTWIAQSKTNNNLEFVLPFIVERKRMDDLGHSIKDGRFHEQKFRLRKCGLANVIYLVENYGSNQHVGLPIQSLNQALANTEVHDGFRIHMTDSLTHTARFLAMMTKRLTVEYKDKTLIGRNGEISKENNLLMTFSHFNQSSKKTKTLTVTETFIKILLQLKGMSIEKALAITSVYKTPKSLIDEYQGSYQKDGEMLLSNLKYGNLGRNVGPTVSKAIYQLFTIKDIQ